MPEADRRRVLASLDAHAATGSFNAIRTRALALLTIDTGLRLSEVLLLRLDQLVEPDSGRGLRIVSSFELEKTQAKGRKRRGERAGYTSSGVINVPRRARTALAAYLREAKRRGWMKAPPWRGAVWLTIKGKNEKAHRQLSKRAAQASWTEWQTRSGIVEPYRFHDMRHSAITRWAETTDDPFTVAALARHSDVKTTMRYVHSAPAKLREVAERAAR